MVKNKIYLSASTQENNIGTDGISEETRMYNLRDRTIYFINEGGKNDNFSIYKNTDKSWTLSKIVKHSNDSNVNLHLAFHSNATNTYTDKVRGAECYYSMYNKNGLGLKMAQLWYNEISNVTPTTDRGVMKDSVLYSNGLYELRETNAVAALMEHFYHTSEADVTFYNANVDLFAMGTAIAIYKYYGYTYELPTTIKSYTNILKEVSNYSDVWVNFVKQHPEVNLIGLIQMLYYTNPK